MDINMIKKNIIRGLCLAAAIALMTTSTYAANEKNLKIDGKQINNAVKVINGKEYVLVDSLRNNLEGITVTKTDNAIEINNTDRITGIIDKVSPSVVGIIGKLK